VGIDIERPDPELCEVQTAEQVFSAQELHVLSKFEPGERSAAFFRGWTKKEAYAKCKGAGLTTELKSIETGFAIGSSRLGTLSLLTFECPNKNVATLAIAGVLDKIALWVLPAEKLIAS
jgi:4'-phosphopantetheinyl transferase